MRCLLLLPALLLISACGQTPSAEVSPGVAENEAPVAPSDPLTELASTDCVSAGARVAGVIEGLELMPEVGQTRDGSLSCTWSDPKTGRTFMFVVNTRHSNTTIEKDAEVLTAAKYVRLAAPVFDSEGGRALWRDSKEADGNHGVTLMVILPEAQVFLAHMLPPGSDARILEPVEAVEAASRLLKM